MTCSIVSFCSLPSPPPLVLQLVKKPKIQGLTFSQTFKEIQNLVEQHFNLTPNAYFLCPSSCFLPCQARIGKGVKFSEIEPEKGLSIFLEPNPKVTETEESERLRYFDFNFLVKGDRNPTKLFYSPCSTIAEIFFQIVQNSEGKVSPQEPFRLSNGGTNKSFNIYPSKKFKSYFKNMRKDGVLIYERVSTKNETKEAPLPLPLAPHSPQTENSKKRAHEEETEENNFSHSPPQSPPYSPQLNNKRRKTYEELEEEIQNLQFHCEKFEEKAEKFEKLYKLEQQKVESLISSFKK